VILLDTNVLIYAYEAESPFRSWARDTIAGAISGRGAAINAVCLAELFHEVPGTDSGKPRSLRAQPEQPSDR